MENPQRGTDNPGEIHTKKQAYFQPVFWYTILINMSSSCFHYQDTSFRNDSARNDRRRTEFPTFRLGIPFSTDTCRSSSLDEVKQHIEDQRADNRYYCKIITAVSSNCVIRRSTRSIISSMRISSNSVTGLINQTPSSDE